MKSTLQRAQHPEGLLSRQPRLDDKPLLVAALMSDLPPAWGNPDFLLSLLSSLGTQALLPRHPQAPISEKPPAWLLYTQESIAFSLFNLKQELCHWSKQSSKFLAVLLSWGSESL